MTSKSHKSGAPGRSGHHGWSQDVDETRQQANPSAHRSFHPDEYADDKGPGRTKSAQENEPVPGDIVESDTTRGEEHGARTERGRRDTGSRGRSQRPSGAKDASAFTGVDPQDPPSRRRSR